MGLNPFTSSITRVPTRTVNLEVQIDLPSSEGLTIRTEISILYHVIGDSAIQVLQRVGPSYVGSLILPVFRSSSADVSARYLAKDMHTKSRANIEEAIKSQMMGHLEGRGVIIEAVLLKSVRLPENLSRAIEEKLEAEQESQRMTFVLERERQEADRRKIEAEGIRDANRLMSDGLTEQVLKYKAIEAYRELSKSNNAKVIITDGEGVPLIGE
jgi:regulator of protease activity HflC (stomatin/prohibitin superfamily)